MYGQTKGIGHKVRLVRVAPYDSRVCTGGAGGKKSGRRGNARAAAALVSAALALSVCCGILYSYLLLSEGKGVAAAHAQGAAQAVEWNAGQGIDQAMAQGAAPDISQTMAQGVTQEITQGTSQGAVQDVDRAVIQSADPGANQAMAQEAGNDTALLPRTMYLTFDDGPSEENTATVLDILKEHDIKATFFVVGENVRKHPDVARRIVEEGHTIGIHCNRHEYNAIYESVESYLADFQAAYNAVYEATGVEVKLFRFPGGSINAYNQEVYGEIIAEMTEQGFIYFDWNGCLDDTRGKATPEQLVRDAKASTLGRRKVVMLAHDIVYKTALCLEELIASFPDYQFEPLTEAVKPVQFTSKVAVP